MAKCPYLNSESSGTFFVGTITYMCRLCGQKMEEDDPKIKYTCYPEYGDEYKKCPIYQEN